ncbi:MAG: hypothetical protein KDC95_09720 [Planctomycetes bacterium]|nr:hypothetical protein [Planctomycetota bacterium]
MRRKTMIAVACFALFLVFGCVATSPGDGALHRWWSGLGPVLPHDTFPADCNMCHMGRKWNELRDEFYFDHARETGHALNGAHASAKCLRCHNDRGPIEVFQSKGCAGCHEDVHQRTLGNDCSKCHDEQTWHASKMVVDKHATTRFPLAGAHLAVACHRCHEGALVGKFRPIDSNCATCHDRDLQRAVNPPHIGLGWTDRCDRCHVPTQWNQARTR